MARFRKIAGRLQRILAVFLILGQLWPSSTLAMTIGEEREIGEKLLYVVRREFQVFDDPDIATYINDLGQRVLAAIGPQHFNYHFFIVASNQFNAFAAPSGLIFFYSGLIETMDKEDELVSVLAHEIGHVVSRHIARRMEKEKTINVATMAMAVASLALGNPALSQGLLTGSLAAGQSLSLKYSRIDEEEADRLAYDWMKEMGRDTEAMVEMLGTMRKITRYRSGQIPQYLLTHPNPEARLDYVQSLLAIEGNGKELEKVTNNFAFLRMKYRVMMETKEPDIMRAQLTNLLVTDKDPEQVTMAHYGLALLNDRELVHEKALSHLAKVQEAYPNESILLVDEAIIRINMGELERAQILLENAKRQKPTDLYATFHLARLYQKKGRLEDADKLYREISGQMPEYSQLYYELGQLEAKRDNPGMSHFYLGKYYLYEGKIKLAKQYLTRSGKDTSIAEKYRQEADGIIKRLEELEKS